MLDRKGIILAGGEGSRLAPITESISKQLIPIYDKPMVYYSLSVLMLSNIKDILVISTPSHIGLYKNLLGDGSKFGINISYEIQKKPGGLAEAFILGENFIGSSPVALILGDNLFYGNDFQKILLNASKNKQATVFAYRVKDPQRFGVVEFDEAGNAISIEEKPQNPKSPYAVTGLYFYDNAVVKIAKSIKPSSRGELEITDINKVYLSKNNLKVEILRKGFAWLDTGTPESLIEASYYIYTLEKRQGVKVLCPEEIGYKNGWISKKKLQERINENKSSYNLYLEGILEPGTRGRT
jgi:glucose-1-phosphate thymidylyltransferase